MSLTESQPFVKVPHPMEASMHGREKRLLLRGYLSRGVSIFRKINISF